MPDPVVTGATADANAAAKGVVGFVVAHPKSFFWGVVGETLVIALFLAHAFGVI